MKGFKVPFLGFQVFPGNQGVLYFLPELRGRLIKGELNPTVNGKRELKLGVLAKKMFSREYRLINGGIVLSNRVITDAGVAFLADDWFDASTDIGTMNYHGVGTGTNAEAAGNTALQTETETRALGAKTNPTAPVVRSVGVVAMTGTHAITEHGLFSASSAGTLWDRSVFAALNVVNTDSIEFTYSCTLTSGG